MIDAKKGIENAIKMMKDFVYDGGFYKNINALGAVADGTTDNSEIFQKYDYLYVPEGTYKIDTQTMSTIPNKHIIGEGTLTYTDTEIQWNGVLRDYTLNLPVSKLNDKLYMEMTLPSEADTFMHRPCPIHGCAPKDDDGSTVLLIGAIYSKTGAELPDNFTICLRNFKLALLMKDTSTWELVDDVPYIKNASLYKLPWQSGEAKAVNTINYFEDHIEIPLTKEEFEGYVLHFYSEQKKGYGLSKFRYFALSYECWVKEEEASDKFVATIGVDQVDINTNTIKQGFSGIALNCKPYVRTQIGSTMNRDEIEKYCNFEELSQLHNVHIATNIFAKYSNQYSSTVFPSILSKVNNGDLYIHLFEDGNTYRNHMIINPIKHIYLPYHGKDDTVTGNYCKILSMPISSSSVERITMRIQYFCYINNDSEYKFADLILSIYFNGTVKIKCINSNQANEGDITVLVSSDMITLYAYSNTYWHTIVDIEYLTYSGYDNLGKIVFDEDLLRVGAGSYNINIDKWVSIDTTDCTVYKSPKTCILEDKINTLETRLATLEEQLSSSSTT